MRLLNKLPFVFSLLGEVKALVPIQDDVLHETFVRGYLENDSQVHLEIMSALATRSDTFGPQDVGVLKSLMDTHLGPQNLPIIDAMAKLEGRKAEVEEQEFHLLLNQLNYDMDAMRCHRQTCSDYNSAVTKQRHNWNLNRHALAGKAADAFLKQHCLVITYNPNDNTQAVMQFLKWRKSLADSLQIPEERGYTFALCNLASPSLSHAKELQLFGACGPCMSKGQNLMAVIMPQFSYKRHQNYLAHRMVEDLYITRGLGLDAKWALVFNKKSDTRDNRCLVYDGRLIIPMEVKDIDYVFKNVPLLQGLRSRRICCRGTR